jgi:hypothetical protein
MRLRLDHAGNEDRVHCLTVDRVADALDEGLSARSISDPRKATRLLATRRLVPHMTLANTGSGVRAMKVPANRRFAPASERFDLTVGVGALVVRLEVESK